MTGYLEREAVQITPYVLLTRAGKRSTVARKRCGRNRHAPAFSSNRSYRQVNGD